MNNYINNCICSPSNKFILSATFVAMWLANNLDGSMQNLVGNFLQTVGQNLSSISSINSDENPFCNNESSKNKDETINDSEITTKR